MDLADILSQDAVLPPLNSANKKQALLDLADAAGKLTGLEPRDIFDALLQRERLGSTGLGRGIAIPHVKLKSLKRIVCLFARVATPIAFDSHDDEPVDLVFLLLAPEHAGGDHLKALARISRLVREPATLDKLRAAPDTAALYAVLAASPASHAA